MRKLSMVLLMCLLTGCGTTVQEGSSGSLKVSDDVKYGEEDYQKIVAPSNELGWKLLPLAEPNEQGNRFISSASLFMAVSMVYNGAKGVTKEEIAETLGVSGMEAEELNRANASLMNMLYSDTEEIQLNIANSIWLNEQYQFQEEFAKNNQDYFNAEIEEIDIMDSGSAKRINDWVSESTNGKIEEITEDPLDPNLVTMLLNAVYFKGDWQYPFEEDDTQDGDFHLVDGAVKTMPLMELNETLPYLETGEFQAVSLPYGEGEMHMKVFLPKEGSTLAEFEESLVGGKWDEWNAAFGERSGKVRLPKFGLEYEVALTEPLKTLGMTSAFEREAEFTNMVKGGGNLFISSVKQKTFLNVNEEGSEAAAVTGINVATSGSPEEPFDMQVDRPFFLAIEDTETGLVLFTGLIAEPMSGK